MIDNLDNFSDIHTKDNISSLGLQYPTHHASHLRSKYDQHHTRNIDPVNLPIVHSGSTIDNFREVLKNIDLDTCEENGENAFYICDLAQVYRQYLQWQDILGGRVEAFLAVKCNPDPHVLHLLAKLGLGFDCASQAEVAQVLELGVPPSKIIFANPCKAGSFIRDACINRVQKMTFDNADELRKVARYHPQAKMVLRLLIDDSGSSSRFGEKFGASISSVPLLLETAHSLHLDVVGVAFHVGSGCNNPNLYKDALKIARQVFDMATKFGYTFKLLDVGGGFGHDNLKLFGAELLAGLDQYFPIGCGVQVIAEPGRYFVAEAFELATNIISRRELPPPDEDECDDSMVGNTKPDEDPVVLYYINDGVYGAFNCTVFDYRVVHPEVLTLGGRFVADESTKAQPEPEIFTPSPALSHQRGKGSVSSLDSLFSVRTPRDEEDMAEPHIARPESKPCKIFGPSCDGLDLVCPKTYLPTEAIRVGDWLRFTLMGAYTRSAASEFNGFKLSQVRYTIDPKGDNTISQRLRELVAQSSQ